jgi:chemotaxis family two-component system sensor kinase Cph1
MGYIIDSVKRMDQLITDLLAYSRVGRSGVAEEEINTKEVVDAVLANLRKSMSETEVDIRVGELPRLFCNRSQLIQLFQNLIGNAIKYRSPSRKIQVEIEAVETEKEWRFSVKDNGIGIEPRFKDRIFLMFQRLHHRSEYAGTGIGLAICKKIVESYGGRIWVESVLGKGATFFFTFPSAPRGSNVGLAVRPIWQRPTHGRSDSAG